MGSSQSSEGDSSSTAGDRDAAQLDSATKGDVAVAIAAAAAGAALLAWGISEAIPTDDGMKAPIRVGYTRRKGYKGDRIRCCDNCKKYRNGK